MSGNLTPSAFSIYFRAQDIKSVANVNPEHVVSTEDVNKIRAEAAKQQEQAQQMQQIQQGTEIIKNLGGVDSFGGELATRMGVG